MIAFCHPTGDNWQSKTLVVAISDPGSSIVKTVFDCCISGVETKLLFFLQRHKKCKLFLVTLVTDCFGYYYLGLYSINTSDRWQSKTLILSTNIDLRSLETEFLIAICRMTGDKWQSKTLFISICDPHSSIVQSVFNCRQSKMIQERILW